MKIDNFFNKDSAHENGRWPSAISFFLIGPYLQGEEIIPSQAPLPTPWFTGNLISSGGTVVPRGDFVVSALFFCDGELWSF